MKTKSNYQDGLKILVIITMIIDHLGLYLFPGQFWMRIIGRSAMPLFCFFAGYNFKSKPHINILVIGVILHAFTMWTFKGWVTTNILISIYVGQCYLYFLKNKIKSFNAGYCHVIILASLAPTTWLYIDYGTLPAAIIILGYLTKNNYSSIKITALITIVLTMFHAFVIFTPMGYYAVITLLVATIEYLLMTTKDFKDPIIGFDSARLISRNSLYIYFIHLVIIQIIWMKYFIV